MEQNIDFYEIYDYYYQPIWQRFYFKVFFIVLILLLLGVIIFFVTAYIFRKRKERFLLPWEWAIRELNNLSLKKCSSKSDFKKFYFDLTLIIKKYLKQRYGWDTIDKTDDELIHYLETKKFDKTLLNGLRKFVESALWIKFADADALKIQAERDLKTAHDIVESTRGIKEVL
jgi:hypothetical protein